MTSGGIDLFSHEAPSALSLVLSLAILSLTACTESGPRGRSVGEPAGGQLAEAQYIPRPETFESQKPGTHDGVRQSTTPTRRTNVGWNTETGAIEPAGHAATVMANESGSLRALSALSSSSGGSANVYFRCPACKGEHPLTMMQAESRASFEAMSFNKNCEACPKTGQLVVLSKAQLFWKD